MADIVRIETTDQLEEIFASSAEHPVWIFKHSLTCPVSTTAWGEFQRFVADQGPSDPVREGAVFALIEIQNSRPLSGAVADRTGIRHESPQAILLKGRDAVWHASHWSIRAQALQAAQEDDP